MTRFRFHRGGLKESLETTVTLPDYDTLQYLLRGWAYTLMVDLPEDGIRFECVGRDERTDWDDTYYVTFLDPKDQKYPWKVAGMSDSVPSGTPPECIMPCRNDLL